MKQKMLYDFRNYLNEAMLKTKGPHFGDDWIVTNIVALSDNSVLIETSNGFGVRLDITVNGGE